MLSITAHAKQLIGYPDQILNNSSVRVILHHLKMHCIKLHLAILRDFKYIKTLIILHMWGNNIESSVHSVYKMMTSSSQSWNLSEPQRTPYKNCHYQRCGEKKKVCGPNLVYKEACTHTHTYIHHSPELPARRCHGNPSPWKTHGERWRTTECMTKCKGEWRYGERERGDKSSGRESDCSWCVCMEEPSKSVVGAAAAAPLCSSHRLFLAHTHTYTICPLWSWWKRVRLENSTLILRVSFPNFHTTCSLMF